MELDTADHRRSSGVTSGLHRMLTDGEMMRDDHQVCHGARLVDGTKVAFMATADDFAAVTPKNGGKIGSARRLSVRAPWGKGVRLP